MAVNSAADVSTNAIPLAAPLRIGAVTLNARNLDDLSRYYQHVVGLKVLDRDPDTIRLGAGGTLLLELISNPDAVPRDPRGAGLFHTAFLMPTRSHLALWARHAVDNRFLITGASDHGVSEAIYLYDPEGNGIEIYADRPSSEWRYDNSYVEMVTEPLDIASLIAHAAGEWSGMPDHGTVGHVHLQIGSLEAAEAFYSEILGFNVACRYPGADFFGSGGYHHQIAANIWSSKGAGPRDDNQSGLAVFEIVADAPLVAEIRQRAEQAGLAATNAEGGFILRDPWNNKVKLSPSA